MLALSPVPSTFDTPARGNPPEEGAASEGRATNIYPERLKPPNLLAEDLEKSGGQCQHWATHLSSLAAQETLTVLGTHAWSRTLT